MTEAVRIDKIPLSRGRIAQLARAPASHAGGHRFESCSAHHFVRDLGKRRIGGMGEWPRGLGRWPVTPEVAGSNPVSPAKYLLLFPAGVAQLVEHATENCSVPSPNLGLGTIKTGVGSF